MISSEELFKSTELDVIVPRETYDIPDEADENWLRSITSGDGQRGLAYFDERLVFFFCIKIPLINHEPSTSKFPPRELASFLLHLQITLDAKYIPSSAIPTQRQTVRNAGLSLQLPPARSHSYSRQKPMAGPSIFPPNTPNPTPLSGEADRSYIKAASNEGTILESYVWGDTARDEPPGRNFALFWSASQKRWIAIYRMTLGIAFLRTNFPDPLLSLTASMTLREKALAITPDRKIMLDTLRLGDVHLNSSNVSDSVAIMGDDSGELPNGKLHGLQEANLLDGLNIGHTKTSVDALEFPSSRFSSIFRRAAFSLPPATPMSHPLTTPSTIANTQSTTPILRKSFLKVLRTFSGFQIRMKSVSVPYVIIPETQENEEERRAAGAEERTIVLSVELTYGGDNNTTDENSYFPKSSSSGFSIEDVEVSVGGEGANSYLLRWDRNGDRVQTSKPIFPLFVRPADQFNLLYAIRFWRPSDVDDIADTLRSEIGGGGGGYHSTFQLDFQRPVAIIVYGRPFDIIHSDDDDRNRKAEPSHVRYNAQSFRSRWNCILDLSNQSDSVPEPHSPQDALPTPATPFPAPAPTVESFAKRLLERRPGFDKRHTIGEAAPSSVARPSTLSSHPYRSSTSVLSASARFQSPTSVSTSASEVGLNGRATPPTSFSKKHSRVPSTTAITNIPSSAPSPTTPDSEYPPMTPAYPSYPSDVFPTASVVAQSPVSNFRASTSHLVESHREGGLTTLISPHPYPPTKDNFANGDRNLPIIVSVGLLRSGGGNSFTDTIYPLDTFSLDIFVFNRSERTRRLEVSHYDNGRRPLPRQPSSMGTNADSNLKEPPGLIPLENRIRVGPLRPQTCQSVTMQFLALRVGVHSISTLTLTDVETGYSKNLKSVMDVVIHEPVKNSRLL